MNWYKIQLRSKKDGAGILFTCHNEVLLGLRSENVDNPGVWSVPGGKFSKNDRDLWETAQRETLEEIGMMPQHSTNKSTIRNKNSNDGTCYVTFVLEVDEEFKNKIKESFSSNNEFDKIKWFPLENLPTNIYQKTLLVINKYKSD